MAPVVHIFISVVFPIFTFFHIAQCTDFGLVNGCMWMLSNHMEISPKDDQGWKRGLPNLGWKWIQMSFGSWKWNLLLVEMSAKLWNGPLKATLSHSRVRCVCTYIDMVTSLSVPHSCFHERKEIFWLISRRKISEIQKVEMARIFWTHTRGCWWLNASSVKNASLHSTPTANWFVESKS